MGKGLHKLGVAAFRWKWGVVAGWLVILVALGLAAAHYMKPTSGSVSIPGTQAQAALDRFNELFPNAGARSGRIVVQAPAGKTVEDYQPQITSLTAAVAKVPEVAGTVSPFDNPAAISADKTIAYVTVQVKPEGGEMKVANIDQINQIMEAARAGGLTVASGGDLVNRQPGEILGIGEVAGLLIALMVLVITLGSLVAAGLPVLVALMTVGLSMAGLFALSQVIDINSTTPALSVMLGLAVGIDYSLFIINRYRSLAHEGRPLSEAVGRAVATAGNAVIFAATTVVIALAALSVVRIPFMTTMGLSAAATVATAALVALTLIPATLGILGMRVFGKKNRRYIAGLQAGHEIHHDAISADSRWYRWAAGMVRHRGWVLLVGVLVVGVLAWPALSLRLGLPTDETAATGSSQRQAYELVSQGFGKGSNGPLLVVVEGLPEATSADTAAVRAQLMAEYQRQVAAETAKAQAQFAAAAAAATTPAAQAALQAGIQAAQQQGAARQQAALAQIEQQVQKYAPYRQLNLVAERIAKLDGVKQAQPAMVTGGGSKGVIQVVPESGPSEAKTGELVTYLRDPAHQAELAAGQSLTFGVTGTTAIQIDINQKLADALPVYLLVVIGLSLILLMVAFRSILIPIKATLGFLLSVAAMFGVLVAVFQWGWLGIAAAPGPIVSFIPIIGIGILFGLAMDYEFFLVSGMQEAYHHTGDARAAVLQGFSMGGRVVVAAALIMVSVFAGFITNHDATVQALGFALAVGIFVDAFIVRLLIVPVVMSFLGRAAWWLPRWLRWLPHLSIEGETDTPVVK